MCINNRHMPMIVGQQDAVAAVNFSAPNICNPAFPSAADASRWMLPVKLIGRLGNVAEIAQAVVQLVVVNVVNLIGLFAVGQKPSKAMLQPVSIFKSNVPVSSRWISTASNVANFGAASGYLPSNMPRIRVIAKAFTDRIRNNFVSHAEILLSVVRGAVVGATVTPDLTIFAVSGGNSRGTYGKTPCSTIRQPL